MHLKWSLPSEFWPIDFDLFFRRLIWRTDFWPSKFRPINPAPFWLKYAILFSRYWRMVSAFWRARTNALEQASFLKEGKKKYLTGTLKHRTLGIASYFHAEKLWRNPHLSREIKLGKGRIKNALEQTSKWKSRKKYINFSLKDRTRIDRTRMKRPFGR